MIIETRDDVVSLSGSLRKNQWLTIKAAANLLLMDHPGGIIVDCTKLDDITEEGAKTFLEAIRDIEAVHTRIVVVNLPENVFEVCKKIPGVRSQLPIARTIEEARASLRLHGRASGHANSGGGAKTGKPIIVPLLAGLDLTYGATLAGRLARSSRSDVQLVYFLEVTRTLPLNAPLQEAEQEASEALTQAMVLAKQANANASEHVERVRNAAEGILATIKNSGAELVVIGATSQPLGGEGHDRFEEIVEALIERAPCEVVVGRLKPRA